MSEKQIYNYISRLRIDVREKNNPNNPTYHQPNMPVKKILADHINNKNNPNYSPIPHPAAIKHRQQFHQESSSGGYNNPNNPKKRERPVQYARYITP